MYGYGMHTSWLPIRKVIQQVWNQSCLKRAQNWL